MFQPKSPALYASPEMLDTAEQTYDVAALVEQALGSLTLERFRYESGQVTHRQASARAHAERA